MTPSSSPQKEGLGKTILHSVEASNKLNGALNGLSSDPSIVGGTISSLQACGQKARPLGQD